MQEQLEQTIRKITRQLVAFYHPVTVYLFGSVARAGATRPALAGISAPADIIPWRLTDFDQRATWVKASLPGRG